MAAALYLLQQWRNDKYRSREPEPLVVRCSRSSQGSGKCFLVCLSPLANSHTLRVRALDAVYTQQGSPAIMHCRS